MGSADPFSVFDDDKVNFNKDYWRRLLKVYSETNRRYLSKEDALFLILRLTLQVLAQIRLVRTIMSSTFVEFEQKLNEIHANQIRSDNLFELVNEVHEKLDREGRF